MPRLVVLLLAAALAFAACGEDEPEPPPEQAAQGPSCQKADLALKTPGQLTIATDSPAFSPYFEDDDPTNGRGFESAVAYAIARELGFQPAEVEWTVVPSTRPTRRGPRTSTSTSRSCGGSTSRCASTRRSR
ncbi:MAG: hypothetical protein ACRDPC_04000 [Solirubrobacteraceae bacterium]